jgi:hypothetical protein
MAELKPTEQEISMIASAYCRLQFGFKKCSECPAFNLSCNWMREKVVPITAIAFAIREWEKIRGK